MSTADTNTITQYLSQADVSKALAVSPDTVRRMIRRGDLAAVRVGRQIRIPADALAAAVVPVPVIAGAR